MRFYLRRALFCVPFFAMLLGLSLLGTTYPSSPAHASFAQDCSMISGTVVVGTETQANLNSYTNACNLCDKQGGTFYYDAGGGDIHSNSPGPLRGHCQPGNNNSANAAKQHAAPLLGYGGPNGVIDPNTPGLTPTQRSLAISGSALQMGMGYLADQAAQQEQAQADQEAQAQQEQAERDAQAAQRRAEQAAADARGRAGMCNVFDGSCNQQGSNAPNDAGPHVAGNNANDNPFATPADNRNPFGPQTASNNPNAPNEIMNPGGGPTDMAGRPLPGKSDAKDDPTAKPDRKLGDPKEADHLAKVTRSGCAADHGDVIQLPGSFAYCVIEVDNPEPTNEWHHLIEDPEKADKQKPKIKSPGVAVMGVRG